MGYYDRRFLPKIYLICSSLIQSINTFSIERLLLMKINEPFSLKNALYLIHEFLYDNCNYKI